MATTNDSLFQSPIDPEKFSHLNERDRLLIIKNAISAANQSMPTKKMAASEYLMGLAAILADAYAHYRLGMPADALMGENFGHPNITRDDLLKLAENMFQESDHFGTQIARRMCSKVDECIEEHLGKSR
jgi:hypothetical protein